MDSEPELLSNYSCLEWLPGAQVPSPRSYWEAVTRHREEMELIPVEELDRRGKAISEFHTRMSHLVDEFLAAAGTSGPGVWFAIGDAYMAGVGAARNRERALHWFRQAADAGHTSAMVRLGNAMRHPDHENDRAEAARWYRAAAERGNSSGMVQMGFACREGDGVPQNYEEATRWFAKAIDAGETHSMLHLGRVLARHLDSPTEALTWLLKAAEHGHRESYIELAMLYDQPGTPVHDPSEAVKWYRKVIEVDSGSRLRAMLALARHCAEGDGIERDLSAASEWLHKVMQLAREKSKEHREAAKMLKRLEAAKHATP